MIQKILKYILQEIKETFTPKWRWLLIYIPAFILGMAMFVHDRIIYPPPPMITYTSPKVDIIQKWMDDQKKKFDNLKREKQG